MEQGGNEANRSKVSVYYKLSWYLYKMSHMGKSIEAECRVVVAQGLGQEWVVTTNVQGFFFVGDENVLKLH